MVFQTMQSARICYSKRYNLAHDFAVRRARYGNTYGNMLGTPRQRARRTHTHSGRAHTRTLRAERETRRSLGVGAVKGAHDELTQRGAVRDERWLGELSNLRRCGASRLVLGLGLWGCGAPFFCAENR